MSIFLTADCHFNHPKSVTMQNRGVYDDMTDHDEGLMDLINTTVGRHDVLHIVGDFAFKQARRYRQQIRCKNVFLVRGNHDRYEDSMKAFGDAPWRRILKLETDKKRAVLDHFPQAYWHNCHRGWFHFYGHVHGQKEKIMTDAFPQRRSLDVGVDNAFHYFNEHRPFSEAEVLEILKDRTGHDNH